MSVTLSAADLDRLHHAIRILTAPLDYESVDAWRAAVNRHLRDLLGADSAGFLLPLGEGLPMFSEEHDPADLAAFPELVPPPLSDNTPIWKRMLDLGVGTLEDGYGADLGRYLASPYYNEYAAPGKAHDTLAATVPLGRAHPTEAASLYFWHARPDGRRFGEREVALLRLLLPALRAGVQTVLTWGRQRDTLLHTLDGLRQPALIGTLEGRRLHATPDLEAMLEAEPEAATVRAALRTALDALRRLAREAPALDSVPPRLHRTVRTDAARYEVRGCLYGGPPVGDHPYVVVALERTLPFLPSLEALRARFPLTRRQAEVALLLAQRKTNREVAEALAISPHTARHHTEAVLVKLGLDDRRKVREAIGSYPTR